MDEPSSIGICQDLLFTLCLSTRFNYQLQGLYNLFPMGFLFCSFFLAICVSSSLHIVDDLYIPVYIGASK